MKKKEIDSPDSELLGTTNDSNQRINSADQTKYEQLLKEAQYFIDYHKNIPKILQDQTIVIKDAPSLFSRNFFNAIEYHLNAVDQKVHNYLNGIRRFLKSDPTERSIKNRLKQIAGYSFNVVVSLAKQCINVVRKPISFVYHTIKAPIQLARSFFYQGEKRKEILNSSYESAKNAVLALKDSLIASATIFAAVLFTPYAAPAVIGSLIGMGVVANGIAIGLGVANNLVWVNPISVRAQAVSTIAQGAYYSANYASTTPENYTNIQKEVLKELYNMTHNGNLSGSVRQESLIYMNSLEKHIKNQELKKTYSGKVLYSVNKILEKLSTIINSDYSNTGNTERTNQEIHKIKTK